MAGILSIRTTNVLFNLKCLYLNDNTWSETKTETLAATNLHKKLQFYLLIYNHVTAYFINLLDIQPGFSYIQT